LGNYQAGSRRRVRGNKLTYVISAACIDIKDCGCVEVCPVDCIYQGSRMLYIQPDECIDCGVCEPVCPVEAIFSEVDLPAEQNDYLRINREFFTPAVSGLGSPEGAAAVGPQALDHPVVTARARK